MSSVVAAMESGDIPGKCPRCWEETLYLAEAADDPTDLMPMCLDVFGCEWTGRMTEQEEMCRACGDMIAPGTPAMYTRYFGKIECPMDVVVVLRSRGCMFVIFHQIILDYMTMHLSKCMRPELLGGDPPPVWFAYCHMHVGDCVGKKTADGRYVHARGAAPIEVMTVVFSRSTNNIISICCSWFATFECV